MIESVITIEFENNKKRQNVQKTLEPDVPGDQRERCKVRLEGIEKKLKIKFEAKDETALRASTNTYLKTIALLRGKP